LGSSQIIFEQIEIFWSLIVVIESWWSKIFNHLIMWQKNSKFKIQSPMLWGLNMFSITMHNGGKVVKIDVTCPFCIKCHVSIHSNTSIMSVKTKTRKSLVTFKLPPLQLVTKNGFWSPILRQLKIFGHHRIGAWCCHMKETINFSFSQFISLMLLFPNLLIVSLDNDQHNLENKDLENDGLKGHLHFSCSKHYVYKFVECWL
jgi:hypothetical protein